MSHFNPCSRDCALPILSCVRLTSQVQGRTLDYFILCIGPRKDIRPPLTLTDLHVLASRVRMGKRLYVIGFDPTEEHICVA
jgi:hypothetical protein